MKGYEIIDGSNAIHNQDLKSYKTTWEELKELKGLMNKGNRMETF